MLPKCYASISFVPVKSSTRLRKEKSKQWNWFRDKADEIWKIWTQYRIESYWIESNWIESTGGQCSTDLNNSKSDKRLGFSCVQVGRGTWFLDSCPTLYRNDLLKVDFRPRFAYRRKWKTSPRAYLNLANCKLRMQIESKFEEERCITRDRLEIR